MQIRVAYQGERGAFSERAAQRILGPDISGVPCPSFERMFASLEEGDADCCVAPMENSLAGSIHRIYLDVIGRDAEPVVARALGNLDEMAESVKVLGSYPTRW